MSNNKYHIIEKATSNGVKICILSGVFPPEIGGPAIYAKNLAQGLSEKGVGIKVVTYSGLRKYPKSIQYFLCWLNLLRSARDADIIYSLGITTAGLPPLLASKILRKKFMIRLGGDFLWERAIERGGAKKSLRQFYEEGPKSFKEKAYFYLIKKVLNQADKIVFTSSFQKEIYLKYHGLKEEKTTVIPNPFPDFEETRESKQFSSRQLLYAGRLLKLKNLDTLIDVFGKMAESKDLTLKIVGEGPEQKNLELRIKNLGLEDRAIVEKPLMHRELLEEIQKSYLCILPSFSEITPNFVLECIELGKPILLTKETGYYEAFKNELIFIDPQDKNDIEEKILHLLDEKNYLNYIERIKRIPTDWSWEDAVEKHISIFKEL